jgi:hypothetical protein
MKDVFELRWSPEVGKSYQTRVWISREASEMFSKYQKTEQPPQRFLKKLQYYAENGFKTFEGKRGPIRHEWGGVYRIGDTSTLFRLYGFYETDSRNSFIIIDAAKKRDTKLSKADRSRIENIVKIKERKLWQKKKYRMLARL